jgi:hypothetical protein
MYFRSVGDELLKIDDLPCAAIDVPTACAKVSEGYDIHVTLTFGMLI